MAVNALLALGLLGHSLTLRAGLKGGGITAAGSAVSEAGSAEYWLRAFWGTVAAVDLTVLYLAGSRGALAGLVAGLLTFAIVYLVWGRSHLIRRISMAIIATLFIGGVFLAVGPKPALFDRIGGPDSALSGIAATGAEDRGIGGRIDTAVVGLKAFSERPLLGWGPENFATGYSQHLTADIAARNGVTFDQAHNKLLEELATKGALGLAAYLAVWAYALWVIVTRARGEGIAGQVLTLSVGCALACYFVQNLFLFDTPGTVGQVFLLFALVAHMDGATGRDAFAPSIAEGTDRASRPLLRSGATVSIAGIAVGAIVALALYSPNYGPYAGARTMRLTVDRDITWQEKLDLFDPTFPRSAAWVRRNPVRVLPI